jgi:hypothetical protein
VSQINDLAESTRTADYKVAAVVTVLFVVHRVPAFANVHWVAKRVETRHASNEFDTSDVTPGVEGW